jgi:hypothetical protein
MHDYVLFQKTDVGSYVMKDKFSPYKLIGDVVYPMQPWFYYLFEGEKDGLPIYKTHLNVIQSNKRMLVGKPFGMLKGKFRILLKKINIPLHHILDLITNCICLHNMCIVD